MASSYYDNEAGEYRKDAFTPSTSGENAATLVSERGKTHGNFVDNARISQNLKTLMRAEMLGNQEGFTMVQLEALDMIALKLSRILSGQPNVEDHWNDIAGYATLVVQELDRRV